MAKLTVVGEHQGIGKKEENQLKVSKVAGVLGLVERRKASLFRFGNFWPRNGALSVAKGSD